MVTFRERSHAALCLGALLAAALLGPLLGTGVVLVRDMVFLPDIPLGTQLLGLDGVPRGVPSDLVVALGSRVLPVGLLQDLLLIAIVVGATWGAARLAPTSCRAAALAAGAAYGWSAYLHERLLLGQWAVLLGWAVVPWAARAALEWRKGESGWPAVAWLVVSSLGGASGILLVGLVVAVCGRPLKALAATAVLSLPWILPSLLQPLAPGDPDGVAAFAARADTPFGVLGSLLTGGGVWAPAAVPPGRTVGSLIALSILVVGAIGVPGLRGRLGDRLCVAGGLGLMLALLGSLPGTSDLLRWAVVHVPAAGLLRDGQKWVAPFLLLSSLAFACGAELLLSRLESHAVRRAAAALLVLAPIAALPAAAWGEGGRLRVSTFPAELWKPVLARTEGAVLILPWSFYRAFPWNGDRTVLDPTTKLLQRPVLDDDLPLSRGAIDGEDPLAARLDAAASSGEPLLPALRDAGISQVLVERTTRGADEDALKRQTLGLHLLVQNEELALFDVPGEGRVPDRAPVWPVVVGDLLTAGYGLTVLTRAVRGRRPY